MNSNPSKPIKKSNSVFSIIVIVLTLIFLIIDISVGAYAVVNYVNGLNVADSGTLEIVSVSCVAQPSDSSRYTAHRVNGGSLIEPNQQLVIIQVILLLVAIGVTLSLIKYRGWRWSAIVISTLIIILIMENALFSGFYSAVSLLCNG